MPIGLQYVAELYRKNVANSRAAAGWSANHLGGKFESESLGLAS